MEAATRASDAGDDARTEPLLQRIVALNPRDAEAWHMLAVIAVRGGRSADAVEQAKRALELDRRNTDYLNTLGVAYSEAQQVDQALNCFKRALKERPDFADAHYNLGKTYAKLGRAAEAEKAYLRARRLDPTKGEVAANLALLHLRQGRHDEAVALLAEARSRLPDNEAVAINLSIALHARSGSEAALRELTTFLERHPRAAAAHAELGRLLLAQGRFAEGWREYGWRHGRQPSTLPEWRGKRILLLPDQGLGDQLFFLRFVLPMRERAAHVAFSCPQKLFELLSGGSPAAELRRTEEPAEGFDVALPIGDLPRLVDARDTPRPVAISVAPERIAHWRERLTRLGPPPYLGVAWRAGARLESRPEFAARGEDPLQKEVDIAALASALRAWRGSVLALQRLPLEGEVTAFGRALGRVCHDLCAVNDDLADMAALLNIVDEYVGVSNTNVHVRAGLGMRGRVLVPFPPEFRWMSDGDESPWFPGFRIYRQASNGDWRRPLADVSGHIAR